ncbi:hypothetical protein TNCV_1283171 [Trichonephila clavipes]|uniref:Uncharacterized protein n=1 Tax=Trichonephila clavipes TaxID=2585209 RepID=A0A8X6VPH7_TRICX|nr:hypothetical protein TNCV_1283171 [Trichonephila clavipes]
MNLETIDAIQGPERGGNTATRRSLRIGCGSPVVKVSDHARHVMSSSPIPLNTRRVGSPASAEILERKPPDKRASSIHRTGVRASGIPVYLD